MQLRAKFSMLVWFLAAMTFAGAIGIPKGFNVTTLLIFLCSLGVAFLKPVVYPTDKTDKVLIGSFFAFGVSVIVASMADQFEARGFDKPSRFLLVIPVLFLLLRSKGPKEWLWFGVIIGSILAFLLALYEKMILGVERASGGEHPIMFGNTAMLLGLLSLTGAIYFFSEKRYFFLALALVGGLCGVGASVLSGTRGGWVGVPLIGLFMFWQCRDLLGRKALVSVFSTAILLVVTAIAVPQTGIQQRVNDAVYDITSYIDGSHTETSVGMRFDMWKAAFMMFEQSPVFGVGASQVIPIKQTLAAQGIISEQSAEFGHSHNDYIDALSKRGLVGLLFLLVVYLVPLKLCLYKLRNYKDNWRIRSYAIAGALVPICYMDFGISQVMFAHNIGVMMYAFPIVYFWAALRWAEREELEKASSV